MGNSCCKSCSEEERKRHAGSRAELPKIELGWGKVNVHIGPLTIGPDGIAIKPKFNFGITGSNVYALLGVRDVRNGLAADAVGFLMKSYASQGATLIDLLKSIEAEEHIPYLDDIITAVPDILAAVIDMIGVDIGTDCREVEGVVYVYAGGGVNAGIYLGWLDTHGYNMIGIEGKVAAAASVGMTIKAGLHASREAVRVQFWLGNVGADILVHAKDERSGFQEVKADPARAGAHPVRMVDRAGAPAAADKNKVAAAAPVEAGDKVAVAAALEADDKVAAAAPLEAGDKVAAAAAVEAGDKVAAAAPVEAGDNVAVASVDENVEKLA